VIWYLIYTKRGQEERAQVNLERQNILCYLPLIHVRRLVRGVVETVTEPLFPRYLFVQLDPNGSGKNWSVLRSTRGVTRLITFGDQPAQVDDGLIALLQRREGELAAAPIFEKGAAVQITSGPFSGIEGVYLMADGESRAMVLINLLGTAARLKFPVGHLKSVKT
jgi:transcriptional antiterminator RfaH